MSLQVFKKWLACFDYLLTLQADPTVEIKVLQQRKTEAFKRLKGLRMFEKRGPKGDEYKQAKKLVEVPVKEKGRPGLPQDFAYLLLLGLEKSKSSPGEKVLADCFSAKLKTEITARQKDQKYKEFWHTLGDLADTIPIYHGRSHRLNWRRLLLRASLNSICKEQRNGKRPLSRQDLSESEKKWLSSENMEDQIMTISNIHVQMFRRDGLIS